MPPLPPLLEYAPSGFGKNTLPRQTAIFEKPPAPPPYTQGQDTMWFSCYNFIVCWSSYTLFLIRSRTKERRSGNVVDGRGKRVDWAESEAFDAEFRYDVVLDFDWFDV